MGLRTLADLIMGRSADDVSADSLFFSEDQLRFLIDSSEEPGLIEEDEKKMIASIFQLGETLVRELMVRALTWSQWRSRPHWRTPRCHHQGRSFGIPVYRGNIDHAGLLYAKDMLPPFRDGLHDLSITQLMRRRILCQSPRKWMISCGAAKAQGTHGCNRR